MVSNSKSTCCSRPYKINIIAFTLITEYLKYWPKSKKLADYWYCTPDKSMVLIKSLNNACVRHGGILVPREHADDPLRQRSTMACIIAVPAINYLLEKYRLWRNIVPTSWKKLLSEHMPMLILCIYILFFLPLSSDCASSCTTCSGATVTDCTAHSCQNGEFLQSTGGCGATCDAGKYQNDNGICLLGNIFVL